VDEVIEGLFIVHAGKESIPLGASFLLIFILGYDLDDEPASPILIEGVDGRFGDVCLSRRDDFVEFF
jgi:hypothetical protein